jgi:hypothetical protein
LQPTIAATLSVLYKFKIPQNVPLKSLISYEDLSSKINLSEELTRRYIRSAIALRIFDEPKADHVSHNAASGVLATTTLHDWIGMISEDLGPAAMKATESLQRYPAGDDPKLCPFALANGSNGDMDFFSIVMASPPERMARFNKAMEWSMRVPGMQTTYSVANDFWARLFAEGKAPMVVVDVGGGTGNLAKALLGVHGPDKIAKAIVEDLPEVVCATVAADSTHRTNMASVDDRLEFKAYSFFTEQVVAGADVYLWRCVMHDWPDEMVVQILNNQIPALKKGARVVVIERCLEGPSPSARAFDRLAT